MESIAFNQWCTLHDRTRDACRDYDELDEDGKAKVDGFNAWIELIHEVQSTHHVAFVPLFGGTIVAFFKR